MSLLRQRAMLVSAESTMSDLRPADARLWLVSATSSRSEAALAAPASQAKTETGAMSNPTEVKPKARRTNAASRRGASSRRGRPRGALLGRVVVDMVAAREDMGRSVPCGDGTLA